MQFKWNRLLHDLIIFNTERICTMADLSLTIMIVMKGLRPTNQK